MKTMKRLIVVCFLTLFLALPAYSDPVEDLVNLGRDIGKFEKEIPFFTKSKLTVFFSFDRKALADVFYGVYINDNLVKTGTIEIKNDRFMTQMIGDFPVKSGANLVTLRFIKDSKEIVKKFQLDVPEYRRVAVDFLLSDSFERLRVVTNGWLVD